MGIIRSFQKVFGVPEEGESSDKPMDETPKPLDYRLEANLMILRDTFRESSDVVIRELTIGGTDGRKAAVCYTDGLADQGAIQRFILEALMKADYPSEPTQKEPHWELAWLRNNLITVGSLQDIEDFDRLFLHVLSGNTIILLDGCATVMSAETSGWEDRGVTEPISQTVVRGPRESFTETLRTNTALIRRKIKEHHLVCEHKQIGQVTKTSLALMYIKGIANAKAVEEVHRRLDRIQIDGILESGNIEEMIQDEVYTPFPTVYNTERPDVVAACLLEGRVAILVDGTPFVLIVPSLFIQSFQSAEDYYQRADISTLLRMLRMACFFIALLFPSLYIAITTFHQEMLPTPLLISLAAQREGIPFPAFVEAVIMEITFEILREAGVRMPRAVGQAVSIVGALVIGQAAVEAGIISASMVIVVSLTAIANFVFPSVNMAISVRILRFIMMMLAASFGLYGITLGLVALLLHLNSLRSFGIPYMAPFSPFIADDQKDGIFVVPIWGMFSRPRLISQRNVKRMDHPMPVKPDPEEH